MGWLEAALACCSLAAFGRSGAEAGGYCHSLGRGGQREAMKETGARDELGKVTRFLQSRGWKGAKDHMLQNFCLWVRTPRPDLRHRLN